MEKLQNGNPWLVSAYVDGPSLAAVVPARGPLPVPMVLTLAAGLAETLSAAHAAGVVHGDLNPATVLLTPDGPRLTDFGIAAAGRGLPGTGMPGFTAPEQAAGRDAGPASDIFSLGMVLLYATTGTWMGHFIWHPDQLPPEVRPVIERCLAADPARRPTATQLRTELTGAHPAPATPATRPPAETSPADTATYGTWPAQNATPTPPGTQAPAPYGAWPAQDATPAPPLPAQAKRAGARKVNRRRVQVIAAAALALAVVMAGAVYVIHPWPHPVPRPAGLTVDQRGTTSIMIGWPNPASGPLPDKYVILRDGAVAATVAGNVNHLVDGDLAPKTTYDFRVIAYRGSAHFQPWPDLRATTQTPPLSEAVFSTYMNVVETLEAGGDSSNGQTNGTKMQDNWLFVGDCGAVGPCGTTLTGSLNDYDISAVLEPSGGGSYTASIDVDDYWTCGAADNYRDSTLTITLKPTSADVSEGQWQVWSFTGRLTWDIPADPADGCASGKMVYEVTG